MSFLAELRAGDDYFGATQIPKKYDESIKVSKFQKQIFLFPFEPKNEQNYLFNFLPLESKIGQIKKIEVSIMLNTN